MEKTIKKYRKLKNNPKKFFTDMQAPRVLSVFKRKEVPVLDAMPPRMLGGIKYDKDVEVEFYGRAIRNETFATLFLVGEGVKNFNNSPVLGDILKADDFIGFREKTFFVFEVPNKIEDVGALYGKVLNSPKWHSGDLNKINNVILFNENIQYSELFRSANPNIRTIAIINEGCLLEPSEYVDHIDCLIIHRKQAVNAGLYRDVVVFSNTMSLINTIKQKITQTGKKPFDLLFPVLGEFNVLDEIDDLNSSGVDIIIYENETKTAKTYSTFSEYIDFFSKGVDKILVRESLMHRYSSLIKSKNWSLFLKVALKDGARVEVV